MNAKKIADNPLCSFGLSEISKWQLDFENSQVALPALQRGFVWKVSQIEELWDSILRGYPIGSFLLSKSKDEKLFLLDGQQRATSISLGFYDPWCLQENKNDSFWSLKDVPVVWIDLAPNEKTNTQKFVIRVVTQSHPWGYQRKDNNSILTVSDRRNALCIFREIPVNKGVKYIQLKALNNIFPYDADLPVPLSFVLKAITESKDDWKSKLIQKCKEYLPPKLETKYFDGDTKKYLERLTETLYNPEFDETIFKAIINIEHLQIPGIIIKQEILKTEDEHTIDEQDPTLFVRLNSSGTRIAGEELIYSIYKASFPEAKKLVENIGANFIAPSLVISLVSRLALTEINAGKYPYSINVNDFRKRIKEENFKSKLIELIGKATSLFKRAFELLGSKNDFAIPPVLVKSIIKSSPDLFLMLLQWVKNNESQIISRDESRRILATITALSWFGTDNSRYVRGIWEKISLGKFWSKQVLGIPFLEEKDFVMYPLINPSIIRAYLLHDVVEKNKGWEELYPVAESEIFKTYKSILNTGQEEENEINDAVYGIWDNFINKVFGCKPLVLFAQRVYINESFGDFNQMETLEDTNTPWDWDHIYPASWIYKNWYIDPNTKHWNNSIGNFRALSLEENRSENDSLSPCKRLIDVKSQSFIKDYNDGKYYNDWEFWNKIENRINHDNEEMVKNHLSAIINRLCNIYEEWYSTLNVGELFGYENRI